MLREEFGKIQVATMPAESKAKKALPKSTLDFFSALQEEAPE